MRDLPYDFDLLFDIKTIDHLYDQLINDSFEGIGDRFDLEELMVLHNIPFPKDYNTMLKQGFPGIVWIDKDGTYQDFAPCESEKDNYQRMRCF